MKDWDKKMSKGVLIHGLFTSRFFDDLVKSQHQAIFVLEGRPVFQTSKHACRELNKRKITPTLISDNMAGFLFYKNLVKKVFLSYQAVDHRGALCPIGSLILAVLGKKHHVPVDLYPSKEKEKLMGRSQDICYLNGQKIVPENFKGYVPLTEWVSKKYITKLNS